MLSEKLHSLRILQTNNFYAKLSTFTIMIFRTIIGIFLLIASVTLRKIFSIEINVNCNLTYK